MYSCGDLLEWVDSIWIRNRMWILMYWIDGLYSE